MSRKLTSALRKATTPVSPKDLGGGKPGGKLRKRPEGGLPLQGAVEEAGEVTATEGRKTDDFVKVTVTGSTGKKYNIVVPRGYMKGVPKTWEWNTTRYKVAEMIALGYPISDIASDPDVGVSSRHTIYAWLEHPEFREHVDGLTLETGFANKRERIAGMNRVTRLLFDKVVRELDGFKMNDKSAGALLTALQTFSKQMAQEKDEFVESQKVEQQTTLNGTLGVATVNVDSMLNSKPAEERAELEAEFDAVADEIIRNFTGDK